MWLTTVTYDLVGIRALELDAVPLIESIGAKKEELKVVDGHGVSVAGFSAPDSHEDIEPTATTLVIKRLWNTEAAALEFVIFLNAASEHITATVEEQV